MTEENRLSENMAAARLGKGDLEEDAAAKGGFAVPQEKRDQSEDAVSPEPMQPILTAIYARESLDQNRENQKETETDSVEAQLEVVQSYLEAHSSLQLAGVYTDCFVSGKETSSEPAGSHETKAQTAPGGSAVSLLSTFPAISEFPELIRLLEDVRTGKVHCILVRRFTDFCRTKMETVYYIENLFRYLNVRFIAVEDDFDSGREEDMSRIEALSREKMENTRSHNLSRQRCERAKERAARPDAMPSGSAPYGYLISADGKSYVVDQEIAPFVRMIFKWAAAGLSSPRIAQRMQLLGVETPGQRRLGKAPDPSKWDAHVVLKILQNPNYTGDIYIGRMQQALYKSQARRRTSPEEWVVRENTHEPLVTKEDFRIVQEIIASNDRGGGGRRNTPG